MMKKLATIERITEFKKHPNADRLNLIKVKGWQCVTAETYNVGDLVIYIQIDTTVPRTEWSKFLFKDDSKERERIRTIKLRGMISQGLCLPLDVLNFVTNATARALSEGMDVTELLDIRKYEKPQPKSQDALGPFPTELVAKTDEERLQNVPEVLDELRGKPYVITKKMDGTSGTFIKHNGQIRVCSRNMELKDGNNHYWNMVRKYKLDEVMEEGDVIQAEIIGPGIQKNHSGEAEVNMTVFNYGKVEGRAYSDDADLKEYCASKGLIMVNVVERGVSFDYTLEELLEKADTIKYTNGSQCEGIVIRPQKERFSETLQGRLSFKVISNKFAVKHGE